METVRRFSQEASPEIDTYTEYVRRPGSESNLNLRWRAYETVPGNGLFKPSMFSAMNLSPNDTVLDVGCNEADDLVELRQGGFAGNLVGVEIDQKLIDHAKNKHEVLEASISLCPGKAENLPFEDNSIDHVTALFMLYHTRDPQAAIKEMHRVLKPGGTLAIATSSSKNKVKHRSFEVQIADYLGIALPNRFNDSFTTRDLEKYLGEHLGENGGVGLYASASDLFDSVHYYRLDERMRFDATNYQYYIGSVTSMFGYELVKKGCLQPALNDLVLPVIKKEIETYGVFTDIADRSWAVMTKKPERSNDALGSFAVSALKRKSN